MIMEWEQIEYRKGMLNLGGAHGGAEKMRPIHRVPCKPDQPENGWCEGIRLTRSFDERSRSYPGYVLQVKETIADESGEFIIAVGKAAQAKHRFQAGMEAGGQAVPVPVDYTDFRRHVCLK